MRVITSGTLYGTTSPYPHVVMVAMAQYIDTMYWFDGSKLETGTFCCVPFTVCVMVTDVVHETWSPGIPDSKSSQNSPIQKKIQAL